MVPHLVYPSRSFSRKFVINLLAHLSAVNAFDSPIKLFENAHFVFDISL